MCAGEQRLSIHRGIGWFNNCVVSLKKHKRTNAARNAIASGNMGQAEQIGAALLYTLIHMKMRWMFTPSGGSSQARDDNNNNEKNIQQGLQLADFAYFAFWLKRVEEAFRSRFEKEKEQLLADFDRIPYREFGDVKECVAKWENMIKVAAAAAEGSDTESDQHSFSIC
ncbi:hypothetical protein niasHT_032297 [Heterodera trifolii]|uniref:Uncharacterized protein n=1 Tax=Heterodera trifolii TaxID=157864 RepID=A0ABD2HS64_9BILA